MDKKYTNFESTAEVDAEADAMVRKDNELYADISNIVCESQFNGGKFFKNEVESALKSQDD